MSDIPIRDETSERDYETGFARVLWFDKQAKIRGWQLSERQLIREIIQRERAAQIREKSSLPMVGVEIRSAAWNRGQADALRYLLRSQNERGDQ
jgi:hypothetical protein